MLRSLRPLSSLALLGALAGCGSVTDGSLLSSANAAPSKTPCPGTHTGFFVCMSADSTFQDQGLAQTIAQGLTSLAKLVNSAQFQSQVSSAFQAGSGQGIDTTLASANYIVSITGYCDANSTVLASAVVGGTTIQYNECRVQRDAAGQPDLASVSGVLLHEISHNLGYTHPAVNPSRSTVPYYLGDLVDSDLAGGGQAASPGRATTSGQATGSRTQYDFGD